jgi:hypothetical protein
VLAFLCPESLAASHKFNNNELTLKHFLYIGLIRLMHGCGIGQIPFPLGGFFGKNVAFVSMLAFHFTGTGEGKPLFGPGFRFHFWHVTEFDSY